MICYYFQELKKRILYWNLLKYLLLRSISSHFSESTWKFTSRENICWNAKQIQNKQARYSLDAYRCWGFLQRMLISDMFGAGKTRCESNWAGSRLAYTTRKTDVWLWPLRFLWCANKNDIFLCRISYAIIRIILLFNIIFFR